MITCQHARALFDRYLEGELTPSLRTELHTHQLQCSACQSELAMLETCGDVIAMDRCEPALSGDFTDRVMAAMKMQAQPVRRSWGRSLLVIGSPMAAAASVVLALWLTMPTAMDKPRTSILADQQAAPGEFRANTMALTGKMLTAQEQAELNRMQAMPVNGFVDALLSPLVQGTKNTLQDTKVGAEQLETLIRLGFADTGEKLVAQWKTAHRDQLRPGVAEEFAPGEPSAPSERENSSESKTGTSPEPL